MIFVAALSCDQNFSAHSPWDRRVDAWPELINALRGGDYHLYLEALDIFYTVNTFSVLTVPWKPGGTPRLLRKTLQSLDIP